MKKGGIRYERRLLPLLLLFALVLAGCRASSPLVGAWESTSYSEELQGNVTLRYRFTEDGRIMTEGDGFSLPLGTYSVKGDTLSLTGEDDARSEFRFSIEGDTLILY